MNESDEKYSSTTMLFLCSETWSSETGKPAALEWDVLFYAITQCGERMCPDWILLGKLMTDQ